MAGQKIGQYAIAPGRLMASAKTGSLLLTAGLAAAGLAGCGASGLSTPGAASPRSSASARPSWAAALGPGVTIVAPQAVTPGHDSPGAAVAGEITAIGNRQVTASCDYMLPADQAQCRSAVSQIPDSDIPYSKNAAIGYVVIHGDRAVVGTTGTFCTPGQSPECFRNSDPAAVFSEVPSFSGLWENAMSNSTTQYSLTPCQKVGEKWYIGMAAS